VRGHGGQHVPRLHQLLLDAADARGGLEGGAEVVGADALHRQRHLMRHQLHPQFLHLVDDDEQHLVMLAGAGLLRSEQRIEAEVVAIAHPAREIGLDAFDHRVLRQRPAPGQRPPCCTYGAACSTCAPISRDS
jgi:hypothetical protein